MGHYQSHHQAHITPSQHILRWAPAAVWATVIFRFSSIPGSELPPGNYTSVAHFVVYAVLGALVYVALRLKRTEIVAVYMAIALSSLYGVSDEFHQAFVPGRTPDVIDWVIDTAGAAAGASFSALIERSRLFLARS